MVMRGAKLLVRGQESIGRMNDGEVEVTRMKNPARARLSARRFLPGSDFRWKNARQN